MKYSLPCSVKQRRELTPESQLINATHATHDTHIIETLWVLNSEMSPSTLNELMISINLFCRAHNLSITTRDTRDTHDTRDVYHLTVSGSAGDYSKAFNTSISKYVDHVNEDHVNENNVNGDNVNMYHKCDTETLDIPYEWQDKVMCIMGLDNYPRFRAYHTIHKRLDCARTRNGSVPRGLAPNGSDYFDPLQVAKLYNFPTLPTLPTTKTNRLNGAGQKVGLIELGGGYTVSDIKNYFSRLGLLDIPTIVSIGVDGAYNNPNSKSNDVNTHNVQVTLDIEILAPIVPGAIINVYFAPNTDAGFYNAIKKAIDDNCNTISISWGLAEIYWPTSILTSYDNLFKTAVAKGITIIVANGTKNGTDVPTVDFPSSSPNVLACGGTSLVANTNKTLVESEVAWDSANSDDSANSTHSDDTSGVEVTDIADIDDTTRVEAVDSKASKYFTRPTYQDSVFDGDKRCVPDVCAVADPNTGYVIYCESEGGLIVVGGTSAPLMAGLYARLNQCLEGHVGFLNPHLYSHPEVCCATPGFTGLGSPRGTQLVSALSSLIPPPREPLPEPTKADPAPEPDPATTEKPESVPGPTTTDKPALVSFTVNRTYGKAPLRVNFSNTTPNNMTRFRWDFGDGTNSTVKNPIKVYNKPGTHTVTLTGFDKQGRPSKVTKQNLIVIKGKR